MIIDYFTMNGYSWKIEMIDSHDKRLVDRTGKLTVGTTDVINNTVYLSNHLKGDFLITVLIHELGHCALWSYGLLKIIHDSVYPEYWIEMEEFICNFLADYGLKVFKIAFKSLGYDAWQVIPIELDKYVA